MKATTYHIIMSSGTKLDIEAHSAGEAIYAALRRALGQTVTHCHSGLTDAEAQDAKSWDKLAMPGMVQHEIPPHQALKESHGVKAPKVETDTMFTDAELEACKTKLE